MKFKTLGYVCFALGTTFGASLAYAGSINYTCAANIDAAVAGTCNALNTSIAALYDTTFSNVNASIYIQYGTTGLGESTSGFLNLVDYNTYRSALSSTASGSARDLSALASLPGSEPALYSNGKIEVTSALGQALGLSGLVGTTASGAACFTPGSGGCYNGIITVTNPSDLLSSFGQSLYYRNGAFSADAYDFYSVVEHETDEVLGTSSCISTSGPTLTDGCGGTNASAVDLFRYSGSGTRVFSDTTPGAYFSYDSGATAVATYNTLSNGDDYADYITNCAAVQDATGCLGQSLDITTDGGSEIAILDSIGYNLRGAAVTVPEPGTLSLVSLSLVGFFAVSRRRRATLPVTQ